MTFKDFLDKTYSMLKKAQGENGFWLPESYLVEKTHDLKPAEKWTTPRPHDFLTFYVEWSMGGQRWGYQDYNDKEQISPELEPEDIKELDIILEAVCPNMTLMQYKGVVREIVKRGECSSNGQYSDETTGYKGFHIRDLYESLNKRGLL